jgi:predicted secreted protein
MTISAAFVLYAVIWFLTLLVILPLNLKTQNDIGTVSNGTPPSAPEDPRIKNKMFWTTVITTLMWIPVCLIIIFEVITISDLNFYGKLR